MAHLRYRQDPPIKVKEFSEVLLSRLPLETLLFKAEKPVKKRKGLKEDQRIEIDSLVFAWRLPTFDSYAILLGTNNGPVPYRRERAEDLWGSRPLNAGGLLEALRPYGEDPIYLINNRSQNDIDNVRICNVYSFIHLSRPCLTLSSSDNFNELWIFHLTREALLRFNPPNQKHDPGTIYTG